MESVSELAALARTPVFESLPFEGLSGLAKEGRKRLFVAGSQIVRQGDPSDCMHIIVRGLVRVERSHPEITDPIVLAELGAGETVAEMGVIDDEVRSATVTAIEDTETLEIPAAVLSRVLLQYPEVATNMLRMLSRRLRSTDEMVDAQRTQANG